MSILKDRGIYEGRALLEWMTGFLEAKDVRTFGDLVRCPEAELRYRYKPQVIVSDLAEQRLLVLPRDAHRLGIEDSDEIDVALAVRVSTSIPLFFEPVSFGQPQNRSRAPRRGRRDALQLPCAAVRRRGAAVADDRAEVHRGRPEGPRWPA